MSMGKLVPRKSTIVRAKLSPALRRLPVRELDTVLPEVTELRRALQFFTPRRAKAGLTLPLDEAFTVISGNYRLKAWSWGNGPAVLLLHGWEGHAGQLGKFVEPLTNRGFRVVAVDLPAHGYSTGRRATVLDFANAVCAVGELIGPLHAVIAHSFGGTATALALHPMPQTIGMKTGKLMARRLVMLAPPAGPAHFVQGAITQLALPPERTARVERRIRDFVGVDFADLTVPNFAADLSVPLLLMHDPADRLVPWEHGQAITTAWPGAQLQPVPGRGHRRILTDPQVIAEAVAFVSDAESER